MGVFRSVGFDNWTDGPLHVHEQTIHSFQKWIQSWIMALHIFRLICHQSPGNVVVYAHILTTGNCRERMANSLFLASLTSFFAISELQCLPLQISRIHKHSFFLRCTIDCDSCSWLHLLLWIGSHRAYHYDRNAYILLRSLLLSQTWKCPILVSNPSGSFSSFNTHLILSELTPTNEGVYYLPTRLWRRR